MTRTKIGEANVANGVATTEYTIPSSATTGPQTLYAIFQQDNQHMQQEAYNNLIFRTPTITTINDVLASHGETATFTANVKYNTNSNVDEGTVQFMIKNSGDSEFTNMGSAVNVSNGVATLQHTIENNINTGSEIKAVFIQTDYYGTSTSTSGTLTIRGTSNVVVTNVSANRGDEATITANITDSNSDAINTGEAQLLIDNTIIGENVSVNNGTVTFTYDVANNAVLGSHTIKVKYLQNNDYDAAEGTGTLKVRTPTVLTPVDVSANAGSNVDVVINVKDLEDGGIASGTLNVTINGETVQATVSGGQAVYSYSVPNDASGSISFTATYVQNDDYQGSTMATSGVITIRKAVTIVVDNVEGNIGDTVNLRSTVTDADGPVTSGTVEYEINE